MDITASENNLSWLGIQLQCVFIHMSAEDIVAGMVTSSVISLKTSGMPKYNLLTYINYITSVIFLPLNSDELHTTFSSPLSWIMSKNSP